MPLSVATSKAPSRRRARPEFDDEDRQSVLDWAADTGLSALQGIGNTLDLGGSMVRDVLGGENPLDNLASPLAGRDRLSGRDVLTKWGLTSQNQETGFAWDDPGELFQDVLGFGFEVATDPLTYLTLGGSALGKAGQVLKDAGYLGDVGRVAGRTVGPRVARSTTTLRKMLDKVPEARPAVERAAGARGLQVDNLLDEALGGTVGLSLPFARDPFKVLTSNRANRWLDAAGGFVRDLAPVRAAYQAFGGSRKGAKTVVGQKIAEDVTRVAGRKEAEVTQEMLRDLDELKSAGFDAKYPSLDEAWDDLYRMKEGVIPVDPDVANVVERMKGRSSKVLGEAHEAGRDIDELVDNIEYSERLGLGHEGKAAPGAGRPSTVKTGNMQQRADLLRGIVGGTGDGRKFSRESAAMAKQMKPKQFREWFENQYGPQIPGGYAPIRGAAKKAARLLNEGLEPDEVFEALSKSHGHKVAGPDTIKQIVEDAYHFRDEIDDPGKLEGVLRGHWSEKNVLDRSAAAIADRMAAGVPVDQAAAEVLAHSGYKPPRKSSLSITRNASKFDETGWGGISADSMRVGITKDGKTIGEMTVQDLDDAYRITSTGIDKGARGQGAGVQAYMDLYDEAARARKALESDHSVSASAQRVYDSMEKRGYTVTKNPTATLMPDGRLSSSDGKAVFRVTAAPAKAAGRASDSAFNNTLERITKSLADGGVDSMAVSEVRDRIRKAISPGLTDEYTKVKTGVVKDGRRTKLQADWYKRGKAGTLDKGLFADPVTASHGMLKSAEEKNFMAKMIVDAMADTNVYDKAMKDSGNITVPAKDVLKDLGFNVADVVEGAVDGDKSERSVWKALQRAMGLADDEVAGTLSDGRFDIPQTLADDLLRMNQRFKAPEPVGAITKSIDWATNLTKAGLTGVWPGFHVRNFTSGIARNYLSGMGSRKSIADAYGLLKGKTVKGASKISIVAQQLAERGLPINDEEGTKILQEMTHSYRMGGRQQGQWVANDVGGTLDDFSILDARIPGRDPINPLDGVNFGEKASYNPLNVRGVGDRAESQFAPARIGENVGEFVESMNRIAPFIHQLRKGVDPSEAMQRVMRSHVDYSGRAFSEIEKKVVNRMFPFAKFQTRQIPYMTKELTEHPGGATAIGLRAVSSGHSESDVLPEDVAATAAIPIQVLPDGTKRYITGLGLMEESPLDFMQVWDPQSVVRETVAAMNPLFKYPIEMAAGETFFQKGPDNSGRDLSDLDPPIGRILGNVTGSDEPVQTNDKLEHLLANMPTSRLMTTIKTLTDGRKGALAKAANTLTGMRVTDVSPVRQEKILRELAEQLIRESGGREFTGLYYPEGMELNDQQQLLIDLVEDLDKKSRERKKTTTK